ncbi:MAG TPA: tetratricopeptide repeat protein, partial [Solirubrobacterales bacterium]
TGTPLASDEAASDARSGRSQPADDQGAGGPPAAEEPAPAPATDDAAASVENASTPASGDAAALNDQGHQLIQEGRYDEAIPVLQQAVDSYDSGSQDLTYAYALFNLGNALREAGRPEEAIPVLEQRLEIPNQTETVQAELDLARKEAKEG